MLVNIPAPGGLVLERHFDAAMQVAGDFEPLANDLRVEFHLRENRRVGPEEHRRAAAAGGPRFLQRATGLSLLEAHLPLRAIAANRGHQLARQRIDDAGADSVKTAGGLVVAALELAAGV